MYIYIYIEREREGERERETKIWNHTFCMIIDTYTDMCALVRTTQAKTQTENFRLIARASELMTGTAATPEGCSSTYRRARSKLRWPQERRHLKVQGWLQVGFQMPKPEVCTLNKHLVNTPRYTYPSTFMQFTKRGTQLERLLCEIVDKGYQAHQSQDSRGVRVLVL